MKKNNKVFGMKMPTNDKISSRTSTIAKSLATSIIPRIVPTNELKKEVDNFWKENKKFKDGKFYCAYCSSLATQWDHFHPLIKDSKPTGYITEIQNLVPCCDSCNESKGGKDWKDWLESSPKKASTKHPCKRAPQVVAENIQILEKFEKTFPASRLPIQEQKWFADYWKHYVSICEELKKAQEAAKDILAKTQGMFKRVDSDTKK